MKPALPARLSDPPVQRPMPEPKQAGDGRYRQDQIEGRVGFAAGQQEAFETLGTAPRAIGRQCRELMALGTEGTPADKGVECSLPGQGEPATVLDGSIIPGRAKLAAALLASD